MTRRPTSTIPAPLRHELEQAGPVTVHRYYLEPAQALDAAQGLARRTLTRPIAIITTRSDRPNEHRAMIQGGAHSTRRYRTHPSHEAAEKAVRTWARGRFRQPDPTPEPAPAPAAAPKPRPLPTHTYTGPAIFDWLTPGTRGTIQPATYGVTFTPETPNAATLIVSLEHVTPIEAMGSFQEDRAQPQLPFTTPT